MRAILALAVKDLRLLLRDRTGFFVTFVFPLVYAVFLGSIFGNRYLMGSPAPLAVVDEDHSAVSSELIQRLRESHGGEVRVSSRAEADRQVRDGELPAAIVIPAGFASFRAAPDRPRVELILGSKPHGPLPALDALLASSDLSSGLFGREGNAAGRPRNQYELAFPLGMTWGVLGCTAAFGLSLVIERTRGTLVRLRMAPLSRLHVLTGKAAACSATTIALGVGLFAVAALLFHVRPRSYALLAMALVATSIGFVGIMMFLSVLGKSEQAASGITWTILLAMAMLGGGMVPRFLMPAWLQQLAEISPVRWAIMAVEGAVWRDFTLREMMKPCMVLVLTGVVALTIGAAAFRWTQRE